MLRYTCQVIYSKINSPGLPARRRNIPWLRGATGKNDAVKLVKQLLRLHVHTDVYTRLKHNSFLRKHFNFPLDHTLFQLHIWNAIHQQSADAVIPFIYRYIMSPLI